MITESLRETFASAAAFQALNCFDTSLASLELYLSEITETTWNNVKERDSVRVALETSKLSKDVDPYACAVREKNPFFKSWKAVGHILREISRHAHYLIETEGGFVNGSVISTEYLPSPIPSGGVEIPLLLKFSCLEQKTFEKMKNFVDSLYDYDYSGVNDEESSDEEEAAIVIETDQSKPVSHTAADQSNWSVTLTVVVKKKTSTLTLILMNQWTWPLINFLF